MSTMGPYLANAITRQGERIGDQLADIPNFIRAQKQRALMEQLMQQKMAMQMQGMDIKRGQLANAQGLTDYYNRNLTHRQKAHTDRLEADKTTQAHQARLKAAELAGKRSPSAGVRIISGADPNSIGDIDREALNFSAKRAYGNEANTQAARTKAIQERKAMELRGLMNYLNPQSGSAETQTPQTQSVDPARTMLKSAMGPAPQFDPGSPPAGPSIPYVPKLATVNPNATTPDERRQSMDLKTAQIRFNQNLNRVRVYGASKEDLMGLAHDYADSIGEPIMDDDDLVEAQRAVMQRLGNVELK